MDYSNFTYSESYKGGILLYFDFDIRSHNGHNKKTFVDHVSLIRFIEKNPGKSIYITLNKVEDFLEEEDQLVINLEKYHEFCKSIGLNGENRAQAFFARKVKHFSEKERLQIISDAGQTEILERVRKFSEEEKESALLENLSDTVLLKIFKKMSLKDQELLFQLLNSTLDLSKHLNLTESNAKGIFLKIIDNENRNIVIKNLKLLEKENFESLQSILGSAKIGKILNDWELNRDNSNEKYWQTLLEDNAWILQQIFSYPILILQGETYVGGKSSKGRSGQGGVATDFLLQDQSTKSFAVIEIKTPKSKLIGGIYRGDNNSEKTNESYSASSELSGGLIQLQNQIETAISNFNLLLGKNFSEKELNHIDPYGVLISGTLGNLNEQEKKSFFLFRKTVKNISVITFDELFEKISYLKNIFND